MNRLLLLLLVAVITMGVVFFIKKPEVINDIWLWLLGFAGPLIRVFQELWDRVKKAFAKNEKRTDGRNELQNVSLSQGSTELTANDNFDGLTFHMQPSPTMGDTAIGMLYVQNEFFSYTITNQKIENGLMAEGIYFLEIEQQSPVFAKAYESMYSEWYAGPVLIKGMGHNHHIYLQNGITETQNQHFISVSRTLEVSEYQKFVESGQQTFKSLYLQIRSALESGITVRLVIQAQSNSNQHPKAS